MTALSKDWSAFEQRLDALFARGGDPYRAGAVALFDKPLDAITQDDRDIVKSVVLRVLKTRSDFVSELEVLRRASNLFHEIGSAISAESLIVDVRNAILADKLRENLRSSDQIRKIATDGFELCVRALAAAGATDVTIHECGSRDFDEPW